MFFPILQKISLLLMYGAMAIFQKPFTAIFFVLFPVSMLSFLRLRLRGTEQATADLFDSQTAMVAFVQKVTDFFRVIADYGQKQETVGNFGAVVKDFNDKMHIHHTRHCTNKAFAPFITSVIVGVYILRYYEGVRSGDVGVGEFVTGVGIWRGIGSCYQGIYENVLTMQDSLSCLHNVVYYMNLSLDICDRATSKRHLLQELDKAQDASAALFYAGTPTDCALVQPTTDIVSGSIVEKAFYSQDLIQIDVEKINFTYPSQGDVPAKPVLIDASFEISQGQLVGAIGPTGSGKATLLQLLGGVLVPAHGSGLCFLPPHLRVLHVTRDPLIFHDCSLWDNLLYGEVAEEDRDPQRVVQICKRIGMSPDVLESLQHASRPCVVRKPESSSHCGTGHSVANREVAEQKAFSMTNITYTDRCLIHLARALIVNPDVLVVHKPLTHFNGTDMECVLEMLREFVDMRGLETPVEMRRCRRPRTCIMSMASLDGIDIPDLVLQVKDNKVEEVNMTVIAELEHRSRELRDRVDINGDGFVARAEFINEVKKSLELAKLFDISDEVFSNSDAKVNEMLGQAFDDLDFSNVGRITSDEMMKCLQHQMQTHMPTKRSQRADIHTNGNGSVNSTSKDASQIQVDLPPMPDVESAMPVLPPSTPTIAPAQQRVLAGQFSQDRRAESLQVCNFPWA